ncbi:MAG: hypothetical protein V1731_00310 [Candidatus Aenigmatarchaeota archaeon]
MTTSQAWEARELRMPTQKSVAERRLKALQALQTGYGASGYFGEKQAWEESLRGAGIAWGAPETILGNLFMSGLLSRQYRGITHAHYRGNAYYYRVNPGAIDAIQRDIGKRSGQAQ